MNKYLIKNFDWFMLTTVLLISLIGVITIFSATRPLEEGGHSNFYIKQFIWVFIGIIGLITVVSFDYVWLGRASYIIYVLGIGLLLATYIIGRAGGGAQRWISLGVFSFQPSELFKLCFVVMFTRYLTLIKAPLSGWAVIKAFLAFTALPFFLLLKQPDLGTALILILLFAFLTLIRGVKRNVVFFLLIAGIISIPFLGNIFWDELRDYQKNRLVAFMEPDVDPSGIGYQITQSKVAIGSGKFLGKGFLKGTQGPFRFLPEKHTDFIFSMFAEEWGFLGSIVLLLIYLGFVYRSIDTAKNAKDDFGRLLATGITFMLSMYIVFNMGMAMGLLPIIGIPLPFMSYGGTALLSNFIAVGILISIRARRFDLFY
ncbi:MAG: rod shape-determining protein RodA [Nitrospirae bacterium]|nr:rod shape-determining protein RodA [Nitrospirota bacterium]